MYFPTDPGMCFKLKPKHAAPSLLLPLGIRWQSRGPHITEEVTSSSILSYGLEHKYRVERNLYSTVSMPIRLVQNKTLRNTEQVFIDRRPTSRRLRDLFLVAVFQIQVLLVHRSCHRYSGSSDLSSRAVLVVHLY